MRCTIGLACLALISACFDAGDDVDLEVTAQGLVGIDSVVGHTPYNATSPKQLDLVCPAGKVGISITYGADNGSTALDNLTLGAEVLAGGQRWRVRSAELSGAPSWSLWAGLTCVEPPIGYELVTATSPGGAGLQELELACSPGNVVLGAAFAPASTLRFPSLAKIMMSMPSTDGTSWRAHVRPLGGSGKIRGTLVCADPWELPGYQVITSTGPLGTGSFGSGYLECPDFGSALSGGWTAFDTYDQVLEANSYFELHNANGWRERVRLEGGWTDPWKLQTAAVCIANWW